MYGLLPFPIVWSNQCPSSARRENKKKSLPTSHNVYSKQRANSEDEEVQGLIKPLKASTALLLNGYILTSRSKSCVLKKSAEKDKWYKAVISLYHPV